MLGTLTPPKEQEEDVRAAIKRLEALIEKCDDPDHCRDMLRKRARALALLEAGKYGEANHAISLVSG